jgi:hypothetical protein
VLILYVFTTVVWHHVSSSVICGGMRQFAWYQSIVDLLRQTKKTVIARGYGARASPQQSGSLIDKIETRWPGLSTFES